MYTSHIGSDGSMLAMRASQAGYQFDQVDRGVDPEFDQVEESLVYGPKSVQLVLDALLAANDPAAVGELLDEPLLNEPLLNEPMPDNFLTDDSPTGNSPTGDSLTGDFPTGDSLAGDFPTGDSLSDEPQLSDFLLAASSGATARHLLGDFVHLGLGHRSESGGRYWVLVYGSSSAEACG